MGRGCKLNPNFLLTLSAGYRLTPIASGMNRFRVRLYFLNMVIPKTSITSQKVIKMKKRIFAIPAAPAAISVNPKTPATTAIMRKAKDHFNIEFILYG
jgi:hypothetical protein